MHILKSNWIPQALFVFAGLFSTIFLFNLPEKQWWYWYVLTLVILMTGTALKEIVEVFIKKQDDISAQSCNEASHNVTREHLQLRDEILKLIAVVKPNMQRHTANGFFDGYCLRLIDTKSIALCTITLESVREHNLSTDEKRSYDIERIYYIPKGLAQSVRTICDAMFISDINGELHMDTWVPQGNHDWMLAEEHIASNQELRELNDYLRCIVELK